MKTLLKILTPAISTLGIATIALTSCQNPKGDGYVAIPTTYLNITNDGKTLEDLKPGDQGEDKDLASMGYSKVTIPATITKASMSGTAAIGYKAIQKIDYESGCACTSLSVSGLVNLVCVVLSPKLTWSSLSPSIIQTCAKVSTIDISNMENINVLDTTDNWVSGVADKGTLIVPKGKSTVGNSILTNQGLTNWTVTEK